MNKTNVSKWLAAGLLAFLFANPAFAQTTDPATSACPDGTTSCTVTNQHQGDVDNSSSADGSQSNASQSNPSSNSNQSGNAMEGNYDNSSQNSSNTTGEINGTISGGNNSAQGGNATGGAASGNQSTNNNDSNASVGNTSSNSGGNNLSNGVGVDVNTGSNTLTGGTMNGGDNTNTMSGGNSSNANDNANNNANSVTGGNNTSNSNLTGGNNSATTGNNANSQGQGQSSSNNNANSQGQSSSNTVGQGQSSQQGQSSSNSNAVVGGANTSSTRSGASADNSGGNNQVNIDSSNRSSYKSIFIPSVVPMTPPSTVAIGNIIKETTSCGPLQSVVKTPITGTIISFWRKVHIDQGVTYDLAPYQTDNGEFQPYLMVPLNDRPGYRMFGHQKVMFASMAGISGNKNFALGGGGNEGGWAQAGLGGSSSNSQLVTNIQLVLCEIGTVEPEIRYVEVPVRKGRE